MFFGPKKTVENKRSATYLGKHRRVFPSNVIFVKENCLEQI